MPLVRLKRILAVSSEDEIHCANNLICPSVSLQWLCQSGYKRNNVYVVLELAKPTRINQIEVGNVASAFVEVLVSSSAEDDHGIDYVSLLPQSILMSSEESKSGRNLTRTKLFSQDKLSKVALDKKWKYVKVMCLQPYSTDRQFGLRFIKFYNHATAASSSTLLSETRSPLSSILSPSKSELLTSFRTPQARKLKSHSYNHNSSLTPNASLGTSPTSIHTPKLPSLKTVRGGDRVSSVTTTPKRIFKMDDSQEFEFSGIEKQSRLLKNTLKGDKSTIGDNIILSRIAAEKSQKEIEVKSGFARKKLLHKELPKTAANEGVDFTATYNEDGGKRTETARIYSMLKISNLDDSSEFGEEPCKSTRGRGRQKRQRVSKRGWLNSRKRVNERDEALPDGFLDLPSCIGEQSNLSNYFSKVTSTCSMDSELQEEAVPISNEVMSDDEVKCISDTEEPICLVEDKESECMLEERDGKRKCPVCSEWIPLYVLEIHASMCAEQLYDRTNIVVVD